MGEGIMNNDLLEAILSLLDFLQEKGVPADRSTEPEVLSLLPQDTASQGYGARLRMAYEMMCFMEQIPGGFLIYQADGGERIVYANKGLLRIFRCDTWDQFLETTHSSFRGLVHPEDLDEVEESIKHQIAESQYDLDYVEYRITRRDGSIGWIEDYGHFVHGDRVGDFFYVFLGDATEKQERRLKEELYQQMQQKQVLMEALENANLAIVAKNEFLSNMSHNMRTPMNAIFGFTALAKLKTADPELLDYMDQVETSGHQLMDMIEKALVVSWIGSKEKELEEECDLCQIAWEACDRLRPQASEKSLDFTLDCSKVEHGLVWSDQERLRQLISNLVSNAVTYTKRKGRVSVAITEDEGSGEQRTYRLTVEDTGIGISKEFAERIFEPFAREKDSTHSGVNGIGLGLTIAKSIVDRLGGTIQMESAVGKGSTFTVVLPLKMPAKGLRKPEEPPAEPPERATGQRILLVEDNEFNREIEEEILKNGGFVVDVAENGKIAVEKVKNSAPEGYDLILMDIQMPVMDGWQASQIIRQMEDPKLSKIPIVALSANTLVRDMRRSLESGMDAYLTKPIDIPKLLEEIRRAAGQKEDSKNS